MQSDPHEHFEDPALKDAVKRAWGGKATPLEIRNRVIASTTQLSRFPLVGGSGHRYRAVVFVAAAAVLLIGCGLLALRIGGFVGVHLNATTSGMTATLPRTLATSLVQRHDGCCRAPDHHMPGLPRSDYSRIATDLKWRLGFPILSAPLKGNGWVFEGACICPVGRIESAHLLFKGLHHQAVSIFSLPASVIPAARNDRSYETVSAGHPISGFVHDGGFYCIVGSGTSSPPTLGQIRAFREELEPQITSPRTTVAAVGP